MNRIRPLIAAASLLLAGGVFAQLPPQGPPPRDIARQLNLDPARAAQVEAIMQATRAKAEALHAQMRALHDSTRQQLATVLSADEMNKLQAAREAHRPPGIAQRLGLDATRSQQVEAIMQATRAQARIIHDALRAATTEAERDLQRQKMTALHDSTEVQLAGVLTAEEMKKLQELRRHRPPGARGAGWRDAPPA